MKKLCILLLAVVIVTAMISGCSDSSTKNEELTSPAASSEISTVETTEQASTQDTPKETSSANEKEHESSQAATDKVSSSDATDKAPASDTKEKEYVLDTSIEPPKNISASILVDGLVFPECPRWHDGKLWFSDMHAGKVITVDMDGVLETIVEVPGNPGGLGWLPSGELLVASMNDSRVLTYDSHSLKELCDLSDLSPSGLNDMVVDAQGRAYVGEFGGDEVFMVTPDGNASIAAGGFNYPNGSVITPDGQTIIIAETYGNKLTAFNINSDGTLSGSHTWINVEFLPDGICIDSEGGIWIATINPYVVRFADGGKMTHVVRVSQRAFACALGGPDLRTLFILTAPVTSAENIAEQTKAAMSGRIEIVKVDIPGIE